MQTKEGKMKASTLRGAGHIQTQTQWLWCSTSWNTVRTEDLQKKVKKISEVEAER